MGSAAPGENERSFRALLESAPVMIWISGVDASCTWFNAGWLRYTGRTLDQELGDGWAQGVHADDLARCLATYMEAFGKRAPFRMEYRLRRADGSYGWVLDDGAPRYDEKGDFLGYVGSCVDISDQKEAQQALRSQRITKALASRMLHDLIHRTSVPDAAVREFGRALAVEGAVLDGAQAYAAALDQMGFGRVHLVHADGKRFEFVGTDLLERRGGAAAPTCHLALGFLEGAVAALSKRRALGNEMTCQSMGHEACRFVVMTP